jgi:tetratricopeptide (TPR) repeat protein
MKNNVPIYTTIISVFLFNCFAQKTKVSNPEKNVKLYHVEENINMKFGGYTTTYNVSDSSLVNTYDLGPNNTRVVTLLYAKEKQLTNHTKKNIKDSVKSTLNTNNLVLTNTSKQNNDYAYVLMIKTYERVAEKGYKSVDIFQKLGNEYYYNAEMTKAAKWYGKLFTMTSDLEPEYYYRYAHSLKAIGENDKANEMLRKFNQLSGNNPR